MKQAMKTTIHAGVAAALGLLAAGAQAVIMPATTTICSAADFGKVTGAAACQVSVNSDQDKLNTTPTTVNADKFFGFNDWNFLAKNEGRGTSLGDGKLQSGDYKLGGITGIAGYGDLMLIFKSGQELLTGYLLADGVFSGTWNSMFEGNNGNFKDVSHISVYGRGTATPPGGGGQVPLPGTLALLAAAGVGLMAFRRKAR